MSLTAQGIESVGAFELPGGVWADGRYWARPKAALVKWRSSWSDKFYQVYVNGKFAGATIDAEQRQLIVPLPDCNQNAVQIEVFAVEPQEAQLDFSGELDCSDVQAGRIKITMIRSQALGVSAKAKAYWDNGTGLINYDTPINDFPINIWPSPLDKAGFGNSQFGLSDFGFDSAAAVGFGRGSFGCGQFGLDADSFEYVTKPLAAGKYKFAVKVFDRGGNESAPTETREITVTPAPKPAEALEVAAFDKQTNQLVLNIS